MPRLLLAIVVAALAAAAVAITASAPATSDPVIAAAGDIACDPTDGSFNGGQGTAGSCRESATSDLLVNGGFTAVLPLGDDQYNCGGLAAFQQSYDPTWGRVKPATHPVIGNHEYDTSGGTDCDPTGNAGGYWSYYGTAAGDTGKGYYSYDIGSWHVIALNSNVGCAKVACSAGSTQEQWLKADLAAHPATCTLAYWHAPRFSSSTSSPASAYLPFWQDLYAARADVILNGHIHNYERFAPQDASGNLDTTAGIREFVVGTGGKGLQGFTTVAPNSEVRNANTFGVLALTLHSGSYDWTFQPEAGKTFTDSGSASCHKASADTTPPSAPSNLTASVSGTSVNLGWGASSDNVGVTRYDVYRSTTSGFTPSTANRIAQPTGTTYTDSNLGAGTYYYVVQAEDGAGNLSASSNQASAVVTAATGGLVAAYSFNEGSGTTVADSSGNGNSGTLSNTSWAASGKYGGALSFNGSSSWVTVANSSSLQLTNRMTLEAWVDPSTLTGAWRCVVIKQQTGAGVDYSLYADTDQHAPVTQLYTTGENDAYGTAVLPTNSWTHLAASWDGTTLRLYVNGNLVSSLAVSGTLLSSTGVLRIGGNSVWGEYFAGLIDEVRIYNRALSQSEIQTDMQTPVGGSPPPGDTTPPTAPTNLTATGSDTGQVSLSWGASTDNVGVTRYDVYRSTTSGFTPSASNRIAQPTGTSYTDSGLAVGTYYYVVEAEDAAANLSPPSNQATGIVPADTTPPTAPTNLTATGSDTGRVSLSWGASTDDVGVTRYDVYRSTTSGFTPSASNRIAQPTGTSYTDSGLAVGTYYYVVEAEDAAANLSPPSNQATGVVPPDTTPPSAPTNLTATGGASSVSLSWGASTDDVGVTRYDVYRSTTSGFTPSASNRIAQPTGTSYTDSSLAAGTYYYLVQAEDAAGNLSASSNQASATVTAASTGLVAAYSFNEGSGTSVADASGNGNTGTLSNTSWTTSGKYGKALSFNGSSSWVAVANSPSLQLTNRMTLEAWVNPNALTGIWRCVIIKQQTSPGVDYSLYADTDHNAPATQLYTTFENDDYGTAVLPLNSWTFLAATWDGTTLRLYVNGNLAASLAVSGTLLSSTGVLQIGGNSVWGEYFSGMIDEVRIYNRALSQTEIQTDMQTPIGP